MQITMDLLYRQLIEKTGEAIIVADRQGIIRLWNHGAEGIFGHSADEAVGGSLDMIIPENLRQRHWQGFHNVMQTGTTRYGTSLLAVPAIHKSGARISIEFTVTLVHDAAGALAGVAAFIRDATARWQKERDLRERLSRFEAGKPQPS